MAMGTQRRPTVTAMVTPLALTEALRTASATLRPPIPTHTAEAEDLPTPIGTATETQRLPTETIWDKASVRHQATPIRLAVRPPSNAATTVILPFGRGNDTQYDIK